MAIKVAKKGDPDFLRAWQKIRERGKASFILKRGLFSGGSMFVIFASVSTFFAYQQDHMNYLPGLFLFYAIGSSITGLFAATRIWGKGERLYTESFSGAHDQSENFD